MRNIVFAIFLSVVLFSCANKAQGPTGGPKDETAPRVVQSVPVNGALNFRKKKIQVTFDENIQVQKVSENVLVSPPLKKMPVVVANGKLLTVEFEDELKDSTTYCVSFANALSDLNESNPLLDYSFSFSTGEIIDTLQISGILINASNLNPVEGVLIGIHSADEPKLFDQKEFLKVAKTDKSGRFIVRQVKSGRYRIYALGDLNGDYIYQQGENIAFLDSVVVPTVAKVEMQDTLRADSLKEDSVSLRLETIFHPNDLVLKYFKEDLKGQYLVKSERKSPYMFNLIYNLPLNQLPIIQPLNFDWKGKYMVQTNAVKDTVNYWITDSSLCQKDTLICSVEYFKSDSLMHLELVKDTLSFINRRASVSSKKKNSTSGFVSTSYQFETNVSPEFDLNKRFQLKFKAPLKEVELNRIHVSERIDKDNSLSLSCKWLPVDSTNMIYVLQYDWLPEKEYEVQLDSAAFRSIYSSVNNKYNTTFKVKSLESYAQLQVKVITEPNENVLLQLLDAKDRVISQQKKEGDLIRFEFIVPGDYYLRVIMDQNRNEKWDTGSWKTHQQPENIYYYPTKLSLRANWDYQELWDLVTGKLSSNKPLELTKIENRDLKVQE